MSNARIAAAACISAAVAAERGLQRLEPEILREAWTVGLRKVFGRSVFNRSYDISPNEAILCLCLAAAVLESE